MALRTSEDELLAKFNSEAESLPSPAPLWGLKEPSGDPSPEPLKAKKTKTNIFKQTTDYEQVRVENFNFKPEERKSSFEANVVENDEALYAKRVKPLLKRRFLFSVFMLALLGGAAELQAHGIETGLAHALDAAILSLFGASGLLCLIDLGLCTMALFQDYSKIKESQSFSLAIASLFQVAVTIIGPVLALASMLFFTFIDSFWSWLDIGILVLLLVLCTFKMYLDLKLFRRQQSLLLGKQLRMSNELTEKQLANLLKKVSSNTALNMTVSLDGNETLTSLGTDLLRQLVERNKKYQGSGRMSTHESLNSYFKQVSEQASFKDLNSSLPISLRSQGMRRPQPRNPASIFNQSNQPLTGQIMSPAPRERDLQVSDAYRPQNVNSVADPAVVEDILESASLSTECHLVKIPEESSGVSNLSKAESSADHEAEKSGAYTKEQFLRCIEQAKLREERLRAKA